MSKAEGFSDDVLAASADGALGHVERAGAGAVALVDAWVARGNAAAVSEVAERGQGPARKAARRGLNVLKSRGVQIPERGRIATLGGPKLEESFEAWMLPPDTAGSTLLVVTAHAPTTRYRAAFVVLHDDLGVQRIDVGDMTHSQLRDNMNRALPGAAYKPVSVPVEWARHRIASARKRHAERGVPEPLGFASAASLLEPVPGQAPAHPFDEEGLELADDDAKDLAKDSVKLHSLPEFRGWFPTRAAVEEMLVKVGETVTPGAEPDPEQMKERLDAEIVAATDRYFSPQRREELVRAMKDSAISVLSREGEQKALEVAAVITCIRNRGLITDAPHEVGFLKGFFDKAVSLLLAQGGGSLRIPVPAKPATEAQSA